MGLLTACVATPTTVSTEGSPLLKVTTKAVSGTTPTVVDHLPDRTFVYDTLPQDINAQKIIKIQTEAELAYHAMDPVVLYKKFPCYH